MLDWIVNDTPLRFLFDDIWRDEAFSYLLAIREPAEIIRITALDFSPPLYYLTLHYWMALFGSAPEVIRLLSVLCYLIGLFFIYEIVRVFWQRPPLKAVVAVCLFMLNPLVLFYAFEARMYAMFFCFFMASSFFMLTRRWVLYILVTVAGLFTHYFMLPVVVAQMVFVIIANSPNAHDHRHNGQTLLRWICLCIPSLVALIPLIPWFVFVASNHQTGASDFWIDPYPLSEIAYAPGYIYTGILKDFWAPLKWETDLATLLLNVSVFFPITILFGYCAVSKKDSPIYKTHLYSVVVLSALLAGVFIVAEVTPLFLPRYLIAASAALSLLTIVTLVSVRSVLKLILLVVFVVLSVQAHAVQLEYRDKEDIETRIYEIADKTTSDDYIYVTSELDYHTVQYYFDPERVKIWGVSYEDIPQYVGKVLIPESAVATELPAFPAKAFIIDNNEVLGVESKFY